MGKDAAERRRFIRLSLEPPIKVRFKIVSATIRLGAKYEGLALIKNISIGGGLLIELGLKDKEEIDKLLSGKEKIYFKSGIPGISKQIKVLGKVAWLKKMEQLDYLYEAGVSFENLDEKMKEDILHAMIDLAFKQRNI